MIENGIILAIFLGAAFFLVRLVFKQFWGKQAGCAKGCGGACSSIQEPIDLSHKS